jgi:hypothetical protein
MPVKPYRIRDKMYSIQLYHYGEGEQPFKEIIVYASDEQEAKLYYQKYKNDMPEHTAISIVHLLNLN